jgi:hypothetical protein
MRALLDNGRVHAEGGGASRFVTVPRTKAARAEMGLYRERTLTENREHEIIRVELPAARRALAAASTEKQTAQRGKAIAKLERERDRLSKRLSAIERELAPSDYSTRAPRSTTGRAKTPPPAPSNGNGKSNSKAVSGEKSFTLRALAADRAKSVAKSLRTVREAELTNTLRRANGQHELLNALQVARSGYERLAGQSYRPTARDLSAADATIRRAWMRQVGGAERVRQLETLGVWPQVVTKSTKARGK